MDILLGILGNAPLEVVVHSQERLDGVGLSIAVDVLLLTLCALAVVVILSGEAQILVVLLCCGLGDLLHLCHLLGGEGVGHFLSGLSSRFFYSLCRFGNFFLRQHVLFLFAHGVCSSLGGNCCALPNIFVKLSAKKLSRAATAA